MSLRHLGAIVLVSFIGVPSFALDRGMADGTITINQKPVTLKYAFAKQDKDFDENDRWVVLLTDRAVSRSVLADDSRLRTAVESGDLVAAVLQFDHEKTLTQIEVQSKALQHTVMPIGNAEVELARIAFDADAIEGALATKQDQEFFSDVAAMSITFRAAVGENGRFGASPAATAELAASRPQLADGAASGTLGIDGRTVTLAHAVARTKPNPFDEKRTDVVVLLTNEPVTVDLLLNDQKLGAAVQNGALRGLLVTIDSDEKPYHMQVLDPEASFQISGSGFWNLDADDFSDKHVTAKFYTTETQSFMDEHDYSYDVTFAVPVQAVRRPAEITIDATTGTKLPAGGGDPGKAYIAFDKAARTGDIEELKRYASEANPLPEMSPEEMEEILEMMKMMRPASVSVEDGFVAGDHATLIVDAEDPDSRTRMRGTIEMTKEGGVWKLLAEKWRQ